MTHVPQTNCQDPGYVPEQYARQSSYPGTFTFYLLPQSKLVLDLATRGWGDQVGYMTKWHYLPENGLPIQVLTGIDVELR